MENLIDEQLEEGEIVDDDNLEDIISSSSDDNSIIESSLIDGKCVSTNRRLRALSLSSISDADDICGYQNSNDRESVKKRRPQHLCRRRKRKRGSSISSSASTDIEINGNYEKKSNDNHGFYTKDDLKSKLKEAIRINDIDENTNKNSLQARLGLFNINNNEAPEPPQVLSPAQSPSSIKEFDDQELENLRLEALRTAVLNKCMRRKKKKAEETKLDNNKENDAQINNNDDKKSITSNENGSKQSVMDLEEDEDILRASLLAAISKKITKAPSPTLQQIPSVQKQQPQKQTIPKPMLNIVPKRIVPIIPKVKPLIIKVNDSSDDDDDAMQNGSPKEDLKKIETTVEKFLKEQRAKVESCESPKSPPDILEKSVVKLLPKSQQIEYHALLKKLKLAENLKGKRALRKKRFSFINTKSQTTMPIKNFINNKVNVPITMNKVKIGTRTTTVSAVTPKTPNPMIAAAPKTLKKVNKESLASELTTLQKILKEIKVPNNGSRQKSLQNQLKNEYQTLTSIIKKISDTSYERKNYEKQIADLEKQLNEARNKLLKSHQDFSLHIKELAIEKDKIDKSIALKQKQKLQQQRQIKKDNAPSIAKSAPLKIVANVATSTPIKSKLIEEKQQMQVEQEVMEIKDPNDIDEIYKNHSKILIKSNVPEYVSPLNNNERYINDDPSAIMCPYEIQGCCRDVDCTFKHYLKAE